MIIRTSPILLAVAAIFSSISARAATITVAPGFNPANSITASLFGVPSTTFTVAVGSWDGANFVQFGQSITDTGTVNGVFSATVPPSVNSEVIHVYVSLGTTVSTDPAEGMWALFRTATNTAFPSDVSSVIVTSTVSFHNTIPGSVVMVAGHWSSLSGNTVNFIPEPSAVLLSALGVVGLLRRRRR